MKQTQEQLVTTTSLLLGPEKRSVTRIPGQLALWQVNLLRVGYLVMGSGWPWSSGRCSSTTGRGRSMKAPSSASWWRCQSSP